MTEELNNDWPQPLTFGGVARFALMPVGRLRLFQTAVALLAAGAVAWLFESAWVPVVNQTIQELPAQGAIEGGELTWSRATPLRVALNTFLWISIDPSGTLEPSQGADLEVELGRNQLRVGSVLGYLFFPYPSAYTIAMNRNEVGPWWGAWHPAVTVGLSAIVFAGLFLVWGILASIYAWPMRLIAFYADRDLSWSGARRVAAAALLPGALFLILALIAYGWRRLTVIQLLAALALHLMIGWVYVLFAPFGLSRSSRSVLPGHNPFAASPARSENPFQKPNPEHPKPR